MSMRWRLATFLLAGTTAANIAGTACYFLLHETVQKATPQPTLMVGSRFPKFTGIDLQDVKWVSQDDAPCRVVRITDDDCSYCRQDRPYYDSILTEAVEASCEIIEMAPRAGGMKHDPRPGVVQLKYVDSDLAAAIFPFATPQTIVIDRDWSVRVNKRGAFDKKSLARTIALLRSISVASAER